MSRDWDAELKKVDRVLESVSDEALLPTKTADTPQQKAAMVTKQRQTTTLGVMLRLLLAVALGVGVLFWPYDTRCGAGLFGYLGATMMVSLTGLWTAVWTWRHRSARGHVLSLLLVGWGALLAAREVLLKVGYASPTESRPAIWICQ
ncbi:MAG: hypothetical protein ACT4R6_07325 [Gemmatimonadaceae bacterium]